MRTGGVLNIFGKLLILLSAGLGAIIGSIFVAVFAPEEDMGFRDGFAIVVLSWLGLAFLGAMPFFFSGQMESLIDCWFESMSGFTTTGSTILTTVEVLPKSVLFWRAMTHWLGGMGIIVLSVAILPLLGVGGTQLFQAEMPGPTKDRLAPRIQDTARILWTVYLLLTGLETLLLMIGGLDFYDALCHSFATLATGGFSTHTASVGYFHSAYIDTVIIVFMFLAGINFTLHFQGLLQNRPVSYWKNEEFRLYLFLIVAASIIIIVANGIHGVYGTLGENVQYSIFQVVSILTTTGFGTADYGQWPAVCQLLLVALMLVGGCAGSTGGGIKVVRLLVFIKYARLQLHNLVHPRSVGTIKINNIRVPREIKVVTLGFFALYLIVFIFASLAITATGVDVLTGASAVIATLNNIGPGLHLVGPAQNFGHLPAAAKLILSFCMLAGRLELYTVAVLLTPGFWKMARKPIYRWQLSAANKG